EEGRGNPSQVDLDEWAARSPAVAVDGLGDQLFARAALARDEHRGVGRGDPADELEDLQKPRIGAGQPAEVEAAVELLPRDGGTPAVPRMGGERQGRLHRLEELGVVPGLRDEVRSAGLHPLDRQADRPPGGNEDHRQPRPQTPDLSQKLQSLLAPGAAGEVHVLNHQIEILLTQEAKSLLRRPGPASRVAVTLEEEAQRGDHRRVVVDEEDHGGIIRSAMPQPAAPGPPACSGRECRRKKSDTSSPWRTPNRSRRPGWRGLRSGREPESGPPGEPRGERPGWSPPTVPAGP